MPTTLEITDGTLTVDLTTTADGKLTQNYLPVFATPAGDGTIPPDITESLPVVIVPSDDDTFAGALQDLATLGRYAAEYTAGNHQTPVWFHRQMQDETGEERCLVKSITYTPDARFQGIFDRAPCITEGRTGVLTITHHPYNERTSAVSASGTNGVSVIGGATNYTDVVGDVNARLYYLHVDNLSAARNYSQFWVGFRSDRRAGGDAGNVASLWELEDGSPGVDTATADVAGASPTGGGGADNVMQCDFDPNTDWESRCGILMTDVVGAAANCAYQVGAYVVLLRAQVDTGAVQVKLRQYNGNTAIFREGPVVEIDATQWTIYNLGTVEWPSRNLHAAPTGLFAASYDQQDSITIYARLSPGESLPITLDMDCLIMIPADEYFLHVQTAVVAGGAGAEEDLYICVAPEDIATALNVGAVTNYFNIIAPVSQIGSGVPVGDGRVFICIANDDDGTAPAYDDQVDVELSTFPRWVHLRGSE